MNKYVIIGNGIAAAGCIEGIRSKDNEGKITVISKESHAVYCRPLISYYLEGKTKPENIGYRSADFYEKNGCEVIYNDTAVSVDSTSKCVTLASGKKLDFTSVCVAAGSSPFVPPIPGLDTVKNKFSFMTLDDAFDIEKAITPDSRVLIIGAGLIGLKCAEGLYGKVKSITVCDLADRILSSILDADTAPIVMKHLETKGISFMMSDSAAEFKGNSAIMKSGKTVDFDILITAVGVRPNTGLVSEAGGSVGRGITVDATMSTDLGGVYAAGDCAEGYDLTIGAKRVLALLPNAYMQGYTAGINMAGEYREFTTGIPMNSIGLLGMHIMTAGSYISDAEGSTVYTKLGDASARKFFVSEGVLKGYILVGNVDRGGIYTALIREKTPLDTVDFEYLKENPSYMAFSAENRRKKFGSVV